MADANAICSTERAVHRATKGACSILMSRPPITAGGPSHLPPGPSFAVASFRREGRSYAASGSVRGQGQPVSDPLTARRVQRGGAGPGRKATPVGEPGDIADVCEDPGGAGEPDPGEVHQPRAPLESVPPSTSTPAWPDQRREGSQQVAAYGVDQATLEVEHPPSVPVIVRCVCRGSGAATMLGAVPDEVVGLASGVTPLLPAPPSCWRCPRFRSCAALGGTGLTDLAGVVSGAGTLVCVGLLGGGATLAWLGVPAAEATAR